jgi:hypothetical protein
VHLEIAEVADLFQTWENLAETQFVLRRLSWQVTDVE